MKKNIGSVINRKPPLKKNILIFLLYLTLISAFLYAPWYYFTRYGLPVCGKFIYSDGKVSVFSNSNNEKKDTALKMGEGDIIKTGKTGRTSVSFEDLISIRLAHFTELEFTRVRLLVSNLFDLLRGKVANKYTIGGQFNLNKGTIWIDKSGGAFFTLRAGAAVIAPEKASFEVSFQPRGDTRISVYRGNVKVTFIDQNEAGTVIFPGKECILKSRKCTAMKALKYRPDDIWQNWNMALSYIAPPRSAIKRAPVKIEAGRAALIENSQSGKRNITRKKPDPKIIERTDPYSLKKWIQEKTSGGKDPYPKYTPSGSKLSRLAFTEFPGSTPENTGDDKDRDNPTYAQPATDPSDNSAAPAAAPAAPKKQAEPYSFDQWVKVKTRGGKDPYPKYTPPSASGAAYGTPFTPEWSAGRSSLPDPVQSPAQKSQQNLKKKEKEDSAESWFPFLKEDSVPPPPPSLNK